MPVTNRLPVLIDARGVWGGISQIDATRLASAFQLAYGAVSFSFHNDVTDKSVF